MTNQRAVAERLLQVKAIQINTETPFTWASGWKSPIYCDNRRILSYPYVREFVKSELCNLVFSQYPDAGLLAGVATAGIAWGAMVADQLKLPFVYVRAKAKEHGLGNQIEGHYEKGSKTIVIEDLVSTGKSSLQVVDALRQAGLEVTGLVSIFTYNFTVASDAFAAAKIPHQALTDYDELLNLALQKEMISPEQKHVLLNWRQNPSKWDIV